MSEEKKTVQLIVDGEVLPARRGSTILEATDAAGVYIPRLCWMKGLSPFGACRVCIVRVNGRPQSACTHPVADGMVIENDSEELRRHRRNLIDMLFVEGNHFCMFCEKSGACELQALAYRFGITAPKYPFLFPKRDLDASHPDVLIDRNRCILCARCVRSSKEIDGKGGFGFANRSIRKRLTVSGPEGLASTAVSVEDAAVRSCPTGSLLVKRHAFEVPVGRRPFDQEPIGSSIESQSVEKEGNDHGEG